MWNWYENKTVLITGASAGIGTAMAELLAQIKTNATILLTARRAERLTAIAEKLKKDYQTAVQTFPLDLSEHNAPQTLFDQIQSANHDVDVLINNAGFGYKGKFLNEAYDHSRQMIQLNITALTSLTKLFLPGMIQRGRGGVCNVSSVLGLVSNPHVATYTATKNFVTAFTESLHGECKNTGVHISCLCPGLTETEFFEAARIEVPGYAHRFMQSSQTVATKGLKGLAKNKTIVLTHPLYSLAAFTHRHLPRRLSAWLMGLGNDGGTRG